MSDENSLRTVSSNEIARMTLEMTKQQKEILDKWLPFGMKKVMIGNLIDDCCYMLEKYGADYISAVVSKAINHRVDLDLPTERGKRNGSDKRPKHSTPA